MSEEIKRDLLSANMEEVIGAYYLDIDAEREIYIDGKKIDPCERLDPDTDNDLCYVLDLFEDGYNRVEDGFEVFDGRGFVIKRKISHIEYFNKK